MKVTLLKPLKRDDEEVKSVTLREPIGGDLRGLKITDILQMDVTAMTKLLPRVTSPALAPDEVGQLCPADLLSLAGGVVSFFVSPAQLADLGVGPMN
jgi:hypothetical protein